MQKAAMDCQTEACQPNSRQIAWRTLAQKLVLTFSAMFLAPALVLAAQPTPAAAPPVAATGPAATGPAATEIGRAHV